jgi:hypothetical protein
VRMSPKLEPFDILASNKDRTGECESLFLTIGDNRKRLSFLNSQIDSIQNNHPFTFLFTETANSTRGPFSQIRRTKIGTVRSFISWKCSSATAKHLKCLNERY